MEPFFKNSWSHQKLKKKEVFLEKGSVIVHTPQKGKHRNNFWG